RRAKVSPLVRSTCLPGCGLSLGGLAVPEVSSAVAGLPEDAVDEPHGGGQCGQGPALFGRGRFVEDPWHVGGCSADALVAAHLAGEGAPVRRLQGGLDEGEGVLFFVCEVVVERGGQFP